MFANGLIFKKVIPIEEKLYKSGKRKSLDKWMLPNYNSKWPSTN